MKRWMRKRGWLTVATLIMIGGCGPEPSNSEETNNGTTGPVSNGTTDSLERACAMLPAPGGSCTTGSDCPSVACRCADGSTISTTSCANGVCEGREACASVCRDAGSSDACAGLDNNGGGSTNNAGTQNALTNGGTTAGPTCDEDLSGFGAYDRSYDLACLAENCCDEAAACEGSPMCRAYDDCILTCFAGGNVDQDCIRACRDQNATEDFLQSTYQPFSACAVNAGC